MQETSTNGRSWLDQPLSSLISLNWETILFSLLIILAIVSRFYDLESRVMSHDETSHVYFSWLFEQGRGYSHDPVTHGPFQFHVVALSYFMFGDNDFTARIPAALFSIATILFMWNYRQIIGRTGAIIAALLLIISPYLLYYGRYVRNEAFVAFFGVVLLWAMLKYLANGENKYLYWIAAISALHFTTKETAFIYTAQAMIFLAFYLVIRLLQANWQNPGYRQRFVIALMVGLLLLGIGGGLYITGNSAGPQSDDLSTPDTIEESLSTQTPSEFPLLAISLILIGGLIIIAGIFFVWKGFTWQCLREERAFGILVVMTTMVIPMLAPFPVKLLGYNPIDYSNTQSITMTGIWLGGLAAVAIVFGLLWNRRVWLICALIFYSIFTIFYTSLFTNGFGFITGMVGSLGYWLEQQVVNRGSQPWYYYWLIQIPIYEFLPALGTIAALLITPFIARRVRPASDLDQSEGDILSPLIGSIQYHTPIENDSENNQLFPGTTITLLIYWSITSLLAYTVAGEKMPWLSVHIALPMILTAAWFLGQLIDTINWPAFFQRKGLLLILLLVVFLIALGATIGSVLGPNPPFQGKELEQLRASSTFIFGLLVSLASGYGIAYMVKDWSKSQLIRVVVLAIFGLLTLLTARSAIRVAYINYDYPTEYLVYAHSGSGPKLALNQIEEISRRMTDDLAIRVAYDNETTYPYWWYLRNYSNLDYFGTTPSRAQRDAPIILVGEGNYGKVEPVVGQAYNKYDYIRIWWPNQDYYDLTWDRIVDAITDPQMRAALFQIWLNRDYSLYSQLTGKDMSLGNWSPSNRMRLYIRKDITSQIWNYGVGPSPEEIIADPYEGKQIDILADTVIGEYGTQPGQFNRPRGVAVAADGTIYVADTDNHRIQHVDSSGNVLHIWGSFADSNVGEAPGGTFYEPWGIDVGPDGSVYVADTWNHRIQKFTPDGIFLNSWGYFGQAESIYAMWGPRDVHVDQDGKVFVSDTGNKRILVFDQSGNAITEFGQAGYALGEFDEPVGIAASDTGRLFVADTWNQRIQEFIPAAEDEYQAVNSWDVVGWYGQSLDNKPFIATNSKDHLFATDPDAYRVLVFSLEGEIIGYFGDLSTGVDGFELVGGIAADSEDGVWVSDSGNSRLMHFTLP